MLPRRCLVLALALTTSSWALAQPRDPAAADALFRDARALMKEGKFAAACPKLAESQRLDPAAGTLINLSDCLQKTGQLADALQALREALDILPSGDNRVGPVKDEIAALDKRVPRLTIRLAPDAPEDTTVTRNEVEYGKASFGIAIPVNPGEHAIVAAAPGRAKKAYPIKLGEGQVRELIVTAGAALGTPGGGAAEGTASPPERAPQATRQTTPQDSPPPTTQQRTLGWVLGGVGVVGLATGMVTGLMLDGRQATVDANCDAKTKLCNDEGYSAAQDGKTLRTVSFIGWGVGLAGIAAGSYFLFFAGPDEPTTAVNAGGTRNGAFVSVSRRF